MEISEIQSQWLVIVNPNAGRGKGCKDWGKIEALLKLYGLLSQVYFTRARHHAINITIDAIEKGYRKIIVVGGDGTMNEVVNGCFIQKTCPTTDITLAIITVGTGNDWGRLFGIPHDYEAAIKIIKTGRIHLQDTGNVNYYHGVKKENRYFLNIAGLGFDAVVVKRANLQKEKGRSGKALYLWNLLRSLIAYKDTQVEVIIDGTIIRNKVFTISLGIGKYSGGGMMQTPNAITDDGLFDITIINKIRKADVIISLKMLYDGSIYDHPKIEGYTGKRILIDSDPLIHVEADGESLGHSPIEFNIIPKSINVICNPEIQLKS
ncbi:MAG: diacylglycerol kinase family lipid kinase [Bacteroidales bacterium]|nr:diacylglycerol kinase family lipid kinase [Bacteroidales bacterium]